MFVIAAPAPARAQGSATDASVAEPSALTQRGTVLKVDDGAFADDRHDRLFQSLNAAFVIAAGTDVSVSMYQIGRGAARESAFGAPWQDSPVAFAITKSAMTAAFAFGLQRIHKNRPKTAFVLGIAATALESWLAVRSARISPLHP
jgi:hypothetical protein